MASACSSSPKTSWADFESGTGDIKQIPLTMFFRCPSKSEAVNADAAGVAVKQLRFWGKSLASWTPTPNRPSTSSADVGL